MQFCCTQAISPNANRVRVINVIKGPNVIIFCCLYPILFRHFTVLFQRKFFDDSCNSWRAVIYSRQQWYSLHDVIKCFHERFNLSRFYWGHAVLRLYNRFLLSGQQDISGTCIDDRIVETITVEPKRNFCQQVPEPNCCVGVSAAR